MVDEMTALFVQKLESWSFAFFGMFRCDIQGFLTRVVKHEGVWKVSYRIGILRLKGAPKLSLTLETHIS